MSTQRLYQSRRNACIIRQISCGRRQLDPPGRICVRAAGIHADGCNTGPRAVPPRRLGLRGEGRRKDGPRVRVISRNGRDHTRRFRDLAAAVAKLSARSLVLDGEVAIFDQQLRSRFDWLREPDLDPLPRTLAALLRAQGRSPASLRCPGTPSRMRDTQEQRPTNRHKVCLTLGFDSRSGPWTSSASVCGGGAHGRRADGRDRRGESFAIARTPLMYTAFLSSVTPSGSGSAWAPRPAVSSSSSVRTRKLATCRR
jgi:hypothetical protein